MDEDALLGQEKSRFTNGAYVRIAKPGEAVRFGVVKDNGTWLGWPVVVEVDGEFISVEPTFLEQQ